MTLDTSLVILNKHRSLMLKLAVGSMTLLSIPVISLVTASIWMSAKYWKVDNTYVVQWWMLTGLCEVWALPQLSAALNLFMGSVVEIKDQQSCMKFKVNLSKWRNVQWLYLTLETLYAIIFLYIHFFNRKFLQGYAGEAHGLCGLIFVYTCMAIRMGLIPISKKFNDNINAYQQDKACQTEERQTEKQQPIV